MPANLMALLPSWVDVAWTLVIASGLAIFARDRIAEFVDAKVQHRYNAELEQLKGSLSADLEKLKADLSRSASEVESLRANVLSLRAQRQAGVEKRRLEAIDQLWAAVKAWQAKKGTATMMSIVKFPNAAREAERNPKMRQFAEIIGGGKIGPDFLPSSEAHEARPYVSNLSWALFNAYQSAIGYLLLQLTVLQHGMDADSMNDPKEIVALLAEALPEWKAKLETHGTAFFPYALEELEKRILAELRRMIAGEDDDAEDAARAVRILAQIEKMSLAERKEEAQAAFTGDEAQTAATARAAKA